MAEAKTLPRITYGRMRPEFPGDGPHIWRCNRCGHVGIGCASEVAAAKEAAEHECPEPSDHPDPVVMQQCLHAIEEIITQGGNGEGWTLNDAALVARVGQTKGLHAEDVVRVRNIMGEEVAEQVTVLDDDEAYQ